MADGLKVVIVGAGFGGLKAVRQLRNVPVDVLLVDSHNYHTFQPLLYQVATAALETEAIAHSARGLFQGQSNFSFRLANVLGVDWEDRLLIVDCCDPISFDYLILAAGSVTNDFGIQGVCEHAFGLKSLEEAVTLRSHIMRQFELADADPSLIERGVLNFVVVGGGPTGVEMAGALTEWFQRVLRKDFPHLQVARAQVFLLEAMGHLLAPFDSSLQQNALSVLRKRGVDVRLNTAVVEVTADCVQLKGGEVIPTRTVVWGAGVKASPLAAQLGVELGRGGRIVVNPDMSIPDRPYAFVIGDLALGKNPDGTPHPQLAQAAIQGGKHVARQIENLLRDQPTTPLVYKDPGFMATIGRSAAVAQFPNGWKFTGFLAWGMWLFLHLLFLVGFHNRAVVFINWLWTYLWDKHSRDLILASFQSPLPPHQAARRSPERPS